IPDDAGVALFKTSALNQLPLANRLDAVGFAGFNGANAGLFREGTGLQPANGITNDAEFSFVRKLSTGLPQDTNDNAADFILVSPDPTTVTGATAQLGAPGPENLGKPTQHNATVKATLIEPLQPSSVAPNRVRDATPNVCNGGNAPSNCTLGTLTIRRRFVNNTGATVTALRFRVVDVTTLNTPNPGGQQADVRLLGSGTGNITTR